MKFVLPALLLGAAIGAGAANASVRVWSDKLRAALAQQEAAAVEAKAKPAPARNTVGMTNGTQPAAAPAKSATNAAAEPAPAAPTGGL